jgi:hypothetical protein
MSYLLRRPPNRTEYFVFPLGSFGNHGFTTTIIIRCFSLIINAYIAEGRTASETKETHVLYLCVKAEAM